MKTSIKLALLSCCLMVTACAPAGYYDSNGVYRSYGKSDSFRTDKPMAGTPTTNNYDAPPSTTTIVYTKPGYYDYNGYYIARSSGPNVPEDLLPPRGMCRVWFTDRPADQQPSVETCNGIQSRVPAGAYVIYGG